MLRSPHIPTADTRILTGGTAYQTDCGMTGPYNSAIGVEKEPILQKFLTAMPVKMEEAKGMVELHSVIVDVDEATGKAVAIRRHTVKGD
jgi:calcineurin-like phosphoesterase